MHSARTRLNLAFKCVSKTLWTQPVDSCRGLTRCPSQIIIVAFFFLRSTWCGRLHQVFPYELPEIWITLLRVFPSIRWYINKNAWCGVIPVQFNLDLRRQRPGIADCKQGLESGFWKLIYYVMRHMLASFTGIYCPFHFFVSLINKITEKDDKYFKFIVQHWLREC